MNGKSNNSIILRLTHEGNEFLFTGDMEADAEQNLCKTGIFPYVRCFESRPLMARGGKEDRKTIDIKRSDPPENTAESDVLYFVICQGRR